MILLFQHESIQHQPVVTSNEVATRINSSIIDISSSISRKRRKRKRKRKRDSGPRPNTRSNIKVAKPQIFNRKARKISGFLIAYKLYIRIRMRNVIVEKQILWILSYI